MAVDATRTVRDLAIEIPNATRAFEKLGIDYCCGGSKSLKDACQQAHLPIEEVLKTLEQDSSFSQPAEAASPDPEGGLCGLVEHIVTKHHTYVKQELPRLQQLLKKVVSVHGKSHPELGQIQKVFDGMSAEFIAHMMKEEHILFPHIVAMEKAVASGLLK